LVQKKMEEKKEKETEEEAMARLLEEKYGKDEVSRLGFLEILEGDGRARADLAFSNAFGFVSFSSL